MPRLRPGTLYSFRSIVVTAPRLAGFVRRKSHWILSLALSQIWESSFLLARVEGVVHHLVDERHVGPLLVDAVIGVQLDRRRLVFARLHGEVDERRRQIVGDVGLD